MPTSADPSQLLASLKRLETWIETHDYKGYEPFDGLGSFLRPLTFGTLFGEIVLQQIGRQSPINLRPLLGVKPKDSSKGRGYIAWAHLLSHARTGDKSDLAKAEQCLDWLDHNRSKLHKEHAWGNTFDYAARGGRIPMDEPTIVWTGLIGQAYLEAFEQTGNDRWLRIADSLCRWIEGNPREVTESGTCLSYVTYAVSSIHNSNMIGAAVLARTAKHTGNQKYLELARSAMEYSCSRQEANGAWFYGHAPKYHWVDNFHTGYNLDALKRYIAYSGDETWRENLNRGYRFFKDHFIDTDGCPRYYHNRRQPIDIQGCAQVIDTLSFFSDEDPPSLELAAKVARWTIKNMQDADGHFYYRRYPLITAKAPMIHWGQATMLKAIAHLLLRVAKSETPAVSVQTR